MVCSICKENGHNKRTCKYKERIINTIDIKDINNYEDIKYNIYIIAKNIDIFNEKI